jgi:glycosyltransferase involved in cell wall biosynthesis
MQIRVIIRGRNCERYIEKCLMSLQKQSYKHWSVHIVLDNPQDGSVYKIHMEGPYSLTVNTKRMGLAHNIYRFPMDHPFKDEDVLAWLDADDWLDPAALDIVARAYQNPDIWLTYGSYIKVSKGRKTKISQPYPGKADVRSHPWRGSHLKTMKYKLFRQIPEDCFKHKGEWLQAASDLALMIPAIELAGLDRTKHIPEALYYWRDNTPFKTKGTLQKECEKIVRAKPKLERIP